MNFHAKPLAFLLCATLARAATVFSEDFNAVSGGSLPAGWVSFKSGTAASGALSFSSRAGGWDTMSPAFDLSPFKDSGPVTLTFDFLSTAPNHSLLVGARTGITDDRPYLAGSLAAAPHVGFPAANAFNGTGTWQRVTVDLSPYVAAMSLAELSTTRLTFLSWDSGVVSTAGVYVDGLQVSAGAIPEPSTYALIFGSVAGVVAWRRRKNSQ